jgi:hypothetical protein
MAANPAQPPYTTACGAATEMNRLLNSASWLASYALNVDAQSKQLADLQHDVETLEEAPLRTNFGAIKMAIDSRDSNKYSKMMPSENLAGVFMGLKLNELGNPHAPDLPRCPVDNMPFIELGRFGTPHGTYPFFDAIHNPALRNHPNGTRCDSVSFIVKHITRAASSRATYDTPVAEMLTARSTLKDAIVAIEDLRTEFSTLCKNIVPRLDAVLEGDVVGVVDSDHDDSDSSYDSASEHDGESSDDEKPTDPSPKRRKTFGEMGTSRDTAQNNVKISSCEVKPARGLSFRTREFKNSISPHIAELFMFLAHVGVCDISSRVPKVSAPTFSNGAQLTYEHDKDERCYLPKDLVFPSSGLKGDTITTSKMLQMAGGPEIMREYVKVQRMAATINSKIRSMFDMVHKNFAVYAHFNLNNGLSEVVNVTTLTVAQQIALGKIYIRVITFPDEESDGEDEEEEEEQGSSFEEESDDEYQEESGEDSGEESDDEDDSDYSD